MNGIANIKWVEEQSTEGKKQIFLQKLKASHSLWDLIGYCYAEIARVGERQCCAGYNDLAFAGDDDVSSADKRAFTRMVVSYRKLFDKCTPRAFDSSHLEKTLKLLQSSSVPYLLHCMALIDCIDQAAELYPGVHRTDTKTVEHASGPLGDRSLNPNVCVFYRYPGHLLKTLREQANARENTAFHDNDSINHKLRLKQLRLLPCNAYLDALTEHRYNDGGFFERLKDGKGPLVLGVSSVCGFDFLNVHKYGASFAIDGFLPETENEISDRYIQTIKAMKAEGVHIALFPEMTLTDGIYDAVCKHLADTPAGSLKILVLGTLWKDRTNRQYTVTGHGELLAVNHKMHSFQFIEDDHEYTEDLDDVPRSETVVVHTLGRILPLICIDALNADYDLLWKAIGVDLVMISAYSPSVATFDQHTQALVRNGWCVACMGNACIGGAQFTTGARVSFVSAPCKKGSLNERESYPITKCGYCSAPDRTSASCFTAFRLYPHIMKESVAADGKKQTGICVKQTCHRPY